MKLAVYEQSTVFQELQPEWNDLLRRSISNRIFSTWEWQSTWWSAYTPGQLWVITVRHDSGQLIGIAPWFIENHPEHGRIVRPIGCVDVTDYLDIIADIQNTEMVLKVIAEFVGSNKMKFEWVNLCNIPEKSPTRASLPAYLEQQGLTVQITQQEVCPIIELPPSWEAYFELLDKKQRHELRRKLRRIEGATENIEWYIVNESHILQEEIERFLHLMAASQIEKAEFLTNTQNQNFFNAIVPIAQNNQWLQMSFLMINGQAAAAYLNFIYEGTVLIYNSGLLPDQFGHLSPGIILLAYNIQHAIQSGYKVFDFLRGNETYKYRMGAQDTRIFMLTAQ